MLAVVANAVFAQPNTGLIAQADSLDSLGVVCMQTTNYGEAIKLFKQALKLYETARDSAGIANSYNNMGVIYYSKSDYDRALEYYKKALEIRLKFLSPEHPDIARSYNNIGTMYASKGDYDQALNYLKKSLKVISKNLGPEHPDVASLYANMGTICASKGDYNCTLEYYKESLGIWLKAFGEGHPNIAASYNNIGEVYSRKGDYDNALTYFKKALDARVTALGAGDPSIANSYNSIAGLYYSKKDYESTLDYLKRALEVRIKTLGVSNPGVAASYNNIGTIYVTKGDYIRALEYFKKSLDIRVKAFGPRNQNVADSYYNIGEVYLKRKEYDSALENLRKSLEIRISVFGYTNPDVAVSCKGLGDAYYSKGDYGNALKYIDTGISIMRIDSLPEVSLAKAFFRDLPVTIGLLCLRAKVMLAQNDDERASIYLKAADELVSRLYNETTESSRFWWEESFYDIYKSGISVNLRAPDGMSEAFRLSEQGRARVFAWQLENSGTSLTNLIPEGLFAQGEYFKYEMSQLDARAENEMKKLQESSRRDAALRNLYRQRLNYDSSFTDWLGMVEHKYPMYAYYKYPQAAGIEEVQKVLGKDEALVSYEILDEGVAAWVISRDKFFSTTLDIRNPEINSVVDTLRSGAVESNKEYSGILYKKLFKPLEEELKKNQVVYIAADGVLNLIPFEMLYDGEAQEYMLNRYKMAYIQSGASLVSLRKIRQNKFFSKVFREKLTAFGNPVYEITDVKGSGAEDTKFLHSLYSEKGLDFEQMAMSVEEVGAISKVLKLKVLRSPEIYTGNDANEDAVKSLRAGSKYIHFACNGYIGDITDKNLQPCVVLSFAGDKGDGFLKMSEIFNLNLSTSLVTLSACKAGSGASGGGVSGLTRAFMCAGAPSVVVSLWKVKDVSRTMLMERFYKNLESGKGKVEALREAKIELIKDGYGSPLSWAPFILFGER